MGARDFFLFSQMGERSSMCERTEKDPIESRERGGGAERSSRGGIWREHEEGVALSRIHYFQSREEREGYGHRCWQGRM